MSDNHHKQRSVSTTTLLDNNNVEMYSASTDEEYTDVTKSDERRKFTRVNTYLPVRLRVERSGRYVETLARNVSIGGVRCLVEGRPAVDEFLALELPLYKEVMPIQIQGRVAWVQPLSSPTQSIVGINFDTLTPSESRALADYLSHLPASLAGASSS